MSPIVKIFLTAAGTWAATIAVSFVMIIITAGVTEKWGASRAGNAMMIMLSIIAILFLAGIIFLHWMAKNSLAGQGSPWLYSIPYTIGVVITFLMIGFFTLVLFNR